MLSSAGMPPDIRKTVDTAVEALETLATVSTAASVRENALAYIGYLASLPWNRRNIRKPDFADVEKKIHEHVRDGESRQKILDHLSSLFVHYDQKPRVLVVDDERIALESLAYVLEKEGYTVVTAGSGHEAIERLKESDIDLVITDLIMGEVDGTAIIKETISTYPDTRVIMITGYATVDTAVQALRMGAFHYIEKPVKVDDLLLAVRSALSQRYAGGKRNVLCLEGPLREAQVALGKMIADVLEKKFLSIALTDISEESEVCGLARTAESARPGRIIDEIRRVESADPVFMLEGLDTAARIFRGEYASVLMDVIAPFRNRHFTDRYVEAPFDLSDVIFIVTAASTEHIESPLRDILEIVRI